MANFFAHSANPAGRWHPLRDHLTAVGKLAAEFASALPWHEEAYLAGVLHDLGKYGDRFQSRLRGEDSGLDHWSAGAQSALLKHHAVAAALAIEGHHIGIQAGSKNSLSRLLPAQLQHRPLSDHDISRLMDRASTDRINPTQPIAYALFNWKHAVAAMLDVRLLFSCLVDADFLDTEAHFNGDATSKHHREPGPMLDPQTALAALDAHMRTKVRSGSPANARVRESRESLWQAVTLAGQAAPGRFTLTAPTGSGKTLSMLKFALEHAARHGLKRIVVAVPFLTVIEQTARVYRSVFKDFPENFVLEHHSLAGLGDEAARGDAEGASERQRRLLSQNWDAPIVLTTNVQLLESLFSNRPSACRKLHNLMEAVILFDEAQSVPQHLAVPTLAALSHLSATYRSTVVFATATQPAFDTLHDAVENHAASGWRPIEAVPGHSALFDALRRVVVGWPKAGEKRSWADLAVELCAMEQVLCVVNLKRHALQLLEEMKGVTSVFHLSTNLCAEHRRAVLDTVRERLQKGEPCRLISTQCVEAGVDVDFPHVYRALAPLEAIAQAAGRCNREGRMTALGKVVVFEPDEQRDWRRRYPTHTYYQATEVTRTMLAERGDLDINAPQVFRDYYRRLYDLNNPATQNLDLATAIAALDFPEIARLYRLIDQDAIQVLVPWADRFDEFETLRAEAEQRGIGGEWMRRAQSLAVNVYRPKPGHPAWGVLIPAKFRRGGVSDEWHILEDPRGEFYDDTLGLILPQSEQVFIA